MAIPNSAGSIEDQGGIRRNYFQGSVRGVTLGSIVVIPTVSAAHPFFLESVLVSIVGITSTIDRVNVLFKDNTITSFPALKTSFAFNFTGRGLQSDTASAANVLSIETVGGTGTVICVGIVHD